MRPSAPQHALAWPIGLVMAILLSATLTYWLTRPQHVTDTSANTDNERRILYYRNPMGLPDTSPTPKQDSMGMDYIPVYEGEAEEEGTVRVSAAKQQRTGVRTIAVTRAPLTRTLHIPGIVTLDERRMSVISLRANAFVEAVADVTTGTQLVEGDPLVTLYAPDFASAAALYASDLKSGERRAEGSRQRLENLGVPNGVISQIARTGKAPVSIQIRAPRNGVVMERMAVEGMMAEPGAPLFRIADTSTLWVMADLPETDLGLVSKGNKTSVTFRALPGKIFEGEIIEIFPALNEMARTAKLRIDLANEDGRLLVGMFAEVEIHTKESEPTLLVPDTALIDTGARAIVLRDLGEGRFAPQEVTIGRRGNGMVEILSGLKESEMIVSSATFLIDAESNLQAALDNLNPDAPEATSAETTDDPDPHAGMDHSHHGGHAQ